MTTKPKLPRCPGCKYAPRIESKWYMNERLYLYRVGQSGFWMDSGIVGPYQPTQAEAIAAWKRMLRTMRRKWGGK